MANRPKTIKDRMWVKVICVLVAATMLAGTVFGIVQYLRDKRDKEDDKKTMNPPAIVLNIGDER